MDLKGVITALITPFKDNKLDISGLEKNLNFQLEAGVHGILPLGTTGETPTLTASEKDDIVKTSVKIAKGKTHIMVGTGGNSTRKVIDNTKQAIDLGADSALVVSPYYNKPTQKGLIRHFEEVAKNSSIPIVVYNIEARTGVNIETHTLKEIAKIDNIVGVKEASGRINQIADVINEIQNAKFKVVSGDDALTLPLMAFGGTGIISVLSNLVPKRIVELYNALESKNYDEARKIHYSLLPLFKVAFCETNPIPIKAAMDLVNLPAGICRLPLTEISKENLEKVKSVLKELNIS